MKKLLEFLKAKKSFLPPSKKKNVILDSSQSFIFKNIFKENNTTIINTRYEHFNLFILLKSLLRLKISYEDYIIEYIRYIECKIIISFIENNIFYYRLKKQFPEKKIILIQSGMRPINFFEKLIKHKNLKIDYLFTFSDLYTSKFKKYVDAKFITLGSFKNNLVDKEIQNNKNSVLFISSGPSFESSMGVFGNIRVNPNIYFAPEKILLPIIYDFCKRRNLVLKILARSKKSKQLTYEKNFYQRIINSSNFEFLQNNDWDQSYKFTDKSKLIVSIYSSMGLESLSRGNRTIFFNVRDKATKLKSLSLFWSDDEIEPKGPIWTNEITRDEFQRLANYAISSSDDEWKKSLRKIIPKFINYDFGNKQLLKVLDYENSK